MGRKVRMGANLFRDPRNDEKLGPLLLLLLNGLHVVCLHYERGDVESNFFVHLGAPRRTRQVAAKCPPLRVAPRAPRSVHHALPC